MGIMGCVFQRFVPHQCLWPKIGDLTEYKAVGGMLLLENKVQGDVVIPSF